ncbi:MAG: hypothetical protein P4L64_06600 [Caulobacteraceae bacterium]|nr:hypothetical protein [Caulobacteraceae bacterium]
MKKASLLLLAAIAATSAVVGAAGAQPYGPPPPYHENRGPGFHGPGPGPQAWDIDRRIDWLQRRIEHGRADGSLDRREAMRAQRALDSIRAEVRRARYRHDGQLEGYERERLQGRLDELNGRLHWMRQNDERRPW